MEASNPDRSAEPEPDPPRATDVGGAARQWGQHLAAVVSHQIELGLQVRTGLIGGYGRRQWAQDLNAFTSTTMQDAQRSVELLGLLARSVAADAAARRPPSS